MAGEYLKSSVHVHSKLCDGKNTLDEIAVTAWRNGLQTLGFSGHSHTPCDLEYCMTQSRTALYKAQVAKLKERYAGKLDILCGLEWDLFSDDDPTQYDYWIGSTHYVKGPKTGKYYEIDWREEDLRACIDDDFDGDGLAVAEAYFANVAKVAEKKPTILGHFDLIKKINGGNKFCKLCPDGRRPQSLRARGQHLCGVPRLPQGFLPVRCDFEGVAGAQRQCCHHRRRPRYQGADLRF